MRIPRKYPVISWVLASLLFTACSPEEEIYFPAASDSPLKETTLVLSVHPLHNPVRLREVYQPIIDLLNSEAKNSGARFQLEASLSYQDYDEKLEKRKHEFSVPNPYQTVRAIHSGYDVIGKMGDDQIFRGILLVRKDAQISSPQQLEGKKISFPAPSALAACMMPMFLLRSYGLLPGKDYEPIYTGSQESSIMQVYLGQASAGATWPPPWNTFQKKEPEKAAEMEVRWETPSLINVSLVARNDVPEKYRAIVRKVFFNLENSENGKKILSQIGVSRFEPAQNSDYEKVSAFLKQYEEAFPQKNGEEKP